jgi:hypothetical protein
MAKPECRWWSNPPMIARYGVAVVSVTAALVCSLWMNMYLVGSPVSLFLCAVMCSAWFGGLKRGLLHRLISGRHTVGFKRVWMLVSCPRDSRYFVAIKMGRRQGGRSRSGGRGSISESIRDRRATRPPAHFHRVARMLVARRLENRPNRRRRYASHL